jgi:thioredoxin reductase
MLDDMDIKDAYDVVVVGGGAAGLNGALMLARSRRSVLVVDAGEPRNAPAGAVHGLLGHDGVPPAELLARGRAEVEEYGGVVLPGLVETVRRDDDGFAVVLAEGRTVRARQILVTSGLQDALPDVPGLAERFGHDVLHCPYCHGWEVRDRAVGVLVTGGHSVQQALLFRQLTDDVVVFTHTGPECTEEQSELLAARGIRVVEGVVTEVVADDERLVGVRLEGGGLVERDALVVAPVMVARAGFLADLGLAPVPHPSGLGEHIHVETGGRTSVPGVWAAGNVTDLAAQVGASAAAGALAGAQINMDLVQQEAAAAVEQRRAEVVAP